MFRTWNHCHLDLLKAKQTIPATTSPMTNAEKTAIMEPTKMLGREI